MKRLTDEIHPVATQTDWKRLRAMTDEDIAIAVADDPDAASIPTAEELTRFKPTPARTKR